MKIVGAESVTITGPASSANSAFTINQGASSSGNIQTWQIGGTVLGDYTSAGLLRQTGATGSAARYAARVTGDTQDRLTISADGTLNWGPGNAATNVNLYWSTTDTLKTDDTFIAGSGLQVLAGNFQVDAQGRVGLGGGLNTAALLEAGLGNAHPSAAVSVMGIETDFTAPATATSGVYGHHIRIRTAASAFTVGTAYQIQVDSPIFGASSAITTLYGARIENQGAANVTNAYGLWLATQSGAVTTNLPLVIGNTSIFSVDSTGRTFVGVTAASGAANGALVQLFDSGNHPSTTTSVRGVIARYTAPSTATTESTGYWWQARTAAAAFTLSNAYGFYAVTPSIGAGSTVSNLYGARIDNQGTSGVTNAYGLFIDTQSGASGNNLPLVVAGTSTWSVDSQGRMGVGTAAVSTVQLNVLNASAHPGNGTNLYGIASQPTFPSTTTNSGTGILGQVRLAASAFSMTSGYALYASTPTVGSGSTLSSAYGLYVQNQGNGGATTSNAYGVWIEAVSGATTNNLPLVVAGTGTWSVDSQGRMGVKASISADTMLYVLGSGSHPGSATALYGVISQPKAPTTNTTSMSAFYSQIYTTASAFTLASAYGFQVGGPSIGAGSTLSNSYGVYVRNQGTSGVTNAYGLWIEAQSGAATDNLALVVNSTSTWSVDSQGRMGVGSAVASTRMIYVGANNHPNAGATIYGVHAETQIPSTATTLMALFNASIRTAAAAFTLTDGIGYQVETPLLGTGSAVTNTRGFYAFNQGKAGVVNAYGFFGASTSAASGLNVTARFDSGSTAALWLGGDGTSTSVSGGIAFGSGRDVTVFRSGSNQLTLHAGTIIDVGSFQVDASGRISLGTGAAPVTDRYFDVGGSTNHPSAAATIRGLVLNYTAPSTATTENDLFYTQIRTAAAAFTLATAYAYFVDTPTIGSGSAVTTSVGFRALNQGNAGITNAYGMWIAATSSAATLNVGARIDTSTTAALWLGGDAAGTAVTGGLTFGSGRDTDIFREAAGVVRVNNIVDATTGFRIGNAAATGNYLRGNGTNFVASTISAGDLPGSFSGFATPSIALSTATAAGSATTTIRSDATIAAFDATTPSALGTAATGSINFAARRDHVHPTTGLATLSGANVFTNGQEIDAPSSTVGLKIKPNATTPGDTLQSFATDGTSVVTKITSAGNLVAGVNAHLGDTGWYGSGYIGFSHTGQVSSSSTGYAILQNSAGQTLLNSASGQTLVVNIANVAVGTFAGTGLTMAQPIAMGTNKITGLGTPTVSTDAATKGYVDAATGTAKYTADFGDGSTMFFSITHNLGSTDIASVLVYDKTSKLVEMPDLGITDANHLAVTYSSPPALNSKRIIIKL